MPNLHDCALGSFSDAAPMAEDWSSSTARMDSGQCLSDVVI